jgi:UDP-N-acetylglucosamine--N-acetylmuramyl-(pentapeptide) pyrophosphoryl-undecaprenol N-acetylglucosamine transferase
MILFFTSPIGLGHATRDLAICEKLNGDCHKTVFISGNGACSLIAKRGYRVLDLYTPEKFMVKAGELHHSLLWFIKYISYYRRCKRDAQCVIENRRNDTIVSDEDFASIALGEKENRKRILITDITETHFLKGIASVLEKKINTEMRKMMARCDCVILPKSGKDTDNLVYVGPIVRQLDADRKALRDKLGIEKKTVLVSIGGTDAGKYLIEKSIEAYRKLKRRMDIDLIVAPGPSLRLGESADFRNLGFVDNLHEFVCASDVIISLAGRSTIDESITYGTPGIFIPIKNHFEQEEGALRLGFRYNDIFRLESLIEDKIESGINTPAQGNGAEKAAKIISQFL